jgi:mono/diheme cytochrome c family protein
MQAVVKWSVRAVLVLLALVAVAVVGLYVVTQRMIDQRYPFTPRALAAAPAGTDVASGAKLVQLFGCKGCHGADLRGQLLFDIPLVARLNAPNLTWVAKTYSDPQIAEMMRSGVRADGSALVGMPSQALSRMTDAEVAAVVAYVRSVPAGGAPHDDKQLRVLGRVLVLLGKAPTAPELVARYAAHPLPDFGPATAEGRGIARACAECHGPDLSGDTGPDLRIAAAYDLPAFTRLLRTGVGLDGQPIKPIGLPEEGGSGPGLMAQTARDREGFGLSDAEIAALHAYLQVRAASLTR